MESNTAFLGIRICAASHHSSSERKGAERFLLFGCAFEMGQRGLTLIMKGSLSRILRMQSRATVIYTAFCCTNSASGVDERLGRNDRLRCEQIKVACQSIRSFYFPVVTSMVMLSAKMLNTKYGSGDYWSGWIVVAF